MRLSAQIIPGWAKLAWLAECRPGHDELRVLHGPMVEARDEFVVEATWPGSFAEGGFDLTELLSGTGVRVRGGQVVFVASGSMLDRLVCCRHEGGWVVSNSLPALLAVTGTELDESADAYRIVLDAVLRPQDGGGRGVLPACPEEIELLFRRDLVFDGRQLTCRKKPDTVPAFADYAAYEAHMLATAEAIGTNMSDGDRDWPMSSLATISSGYDSPVAALMAMRAGGGQSATLRKASSIWGRVDSGKPVADDLGLACREYAPQPSDYRQEPAIWAAVGRAGEVNWTVFDLPSAPCVVFTGEHGDTAWGMAMGDLSRPFGRPGPGGLGLSEYRLWAGLVQCVVPYWCVARLEDLRRISRSEEMAPWRLGNDYDRPLARRMVEEAGVGRERFGMRKMNTAITSQFLWPFTRGAQESFSRFLRERGVQPYRPGAVRWIRRLALADNLVQRNVFKKLGRGVRRRWWYRHPARKLLFVWANDQLRARYESALAGGAERRPTDRPPRVASGEVRP